MDEVRIGDKNYGDRFRSSPKKVRSKKGKKKRLDLTRLDLGDLSKQGDVFRRQETDYLDRFVAYMDMAGNRNYVKGNQILEESIKKEKVCLQHLSDLNLDVISEKAKESQAQISIDEQESKNLEDKLQPLSRADKTFDGTTKKITADLRFDLNPFNKWNHQYVTGKVLTTRDAESNFGPPNEKFLASTLHKAKPAIERSDLPITSAQEIGWFTKTYRPNLQSTSTDLTELDAAARQLIKTKKGFDYKGITTFGLNPLVNHPKRMTDISRYKDTYWSYYPPPLAKFHPKENR